MEILRSRQTSYATAWDATSSPPLVRGRWHGMAALGCAMSLMLTLAMLGSLGPSFVLSSVSRLSVYVTASKAAHFKAPGAKIVKGMGGLSYRPLKSTAVSANKATHSNLKYEPNDSLELQRLHRSTPVPTLRSGQWKLTDAKPEELPPVQASPTSALGDSWVIWCLFMLVPAGVWLAKALRPDEERSNFAMLAVKGKKQVDSWDLKKFPRPYMGCPGYGSKSQHCRARVAICSAGDGTQRTSEVEVEQDVECIGGGMAVECLLPEEKLDPRPVEPEMDCIGGGMAAECAIPEERSEGAEVPRTEQESMSMDTLLGSLLLVSPFFLWGTAMVAMKQVLPATGPFFVASVRLIPSGLAVVLYALYTGRKNPDSGMAWLAVALFALVDGACFQGFLAEGLQLTSAGLGSVIIDSQPITVAILASLFYDERVGPIGAVGLLVGVLGLLLLELPAEAVQSLLAADFQGISSQLVTWQGGLGGGGGLWSSGEWWMLLAAQSMAVGTVMVRWVGKYVDPVMATGWHMVLGGIPLLALSVTSEPEVYAHLGELTMTDIVALTYTSLFGSAISYGLFFYFASKGNLTRLSSLTFLTPMFAAGFGYLLLNETLTPTQLLGAAITLGGITLAQQGGQKTD